MLIYMLLYRCLRYFTCVTLLITLHYCTNDTLCDPVTDTKRPPVAPSRSGSRLAMPMAQATGVSLLDDLMPTNLTPKSAPSPGLLHKSSPAPLREYTEGWVLSYTRKLIKIISLYNYRYHIMYRFLPTRILYYGTWSKINCPNQNKSYRF